MTAAAITLILALFAAVFAIAMRNARHFAETQDAQVRAALDPEFVPPAHGSTTIV